MHARYVKDISKMDSILYSLFTKRRCNEDLENYPNPSLKIEPGRVIIRVQKTKRDINGVVRYVQALFTKEYSIDFTCQRRIQGRCKNE